MGCALSESRLGFATQVGSNPMGKVSELLQLDALIDYNDEPLSHGPLVAVVFFLLTFHQSKGNRHTHVGACFLEGTIFEGWFKGTRKTTPRLLVSGLWVFQVVRSPKRDANSLV